MIHKTETLYIRKPNGRYQAVSELYSCDAWKHGTHLVISQPGLVRILYNIASENVKVTAAIERARVSMEAAMNAACQFRPDQSGRPLTPDEKRGYAAWKKCVGDNRPMRFEGVCMSDIIDAGIDALKKSME